MAACKHAPCTLALCVSLIGSMSLPIHAAETLEGYLLNEGVTGREVRPHHWKERRTYVAPVKPGAGVGFVTHHTPPGKFVMPGKLLPNGFTPGEYALFSLCYDGPLPFSINPGVRVPEGAEKVEGLKLTAPAHYSVMYDTDWKEWGEKPWASGADFFQTFVATTPHVTRIGTKLADKSGDHYHLTLNYAIYEPNDGPPSEWKRISPVRSRFLSGGTDPIIHIFHVAYRSNEVNLTPGRTYALRLWRNPVSQSETFVLVARPDKGDGYAGGHLYVDGQPRTDLDGYAYISGGEPGTVVNHAPVGDMDLKELIGSSQRYGQTFKASGNGLAAVDIIYTTGKTSPEPLPFTFQVFDRPGGKPIGPKRTAYGVPGAFQGRAAALWSRGEVPLKTGKMYYLEWTSPGCNTWKLNEDLPGEAYVDGKSRPEADLALSIAEYTDSGK